jgi:hypothetical protein
MSAEVLTTFAVAAAGLAVLSVTLPSAVSYVVTASTAVL